MSIPSEILELENRSLGKNGEPTLGAAYKRLVAEWRAGSRDREVGLHLMFLSWYLLSEPTWLTGAEDERIPSISLQAMFAEVHQYFAPAIESDAEMLYTVGLMAHLDPFLLGEETELIALSERYRRLYRAASPGGLSPDQFGNRGAYGEYFAHQIREGGF